MGIDRKQIRSSAQKQVRSGNWKTAIDEYEKLVDDDPDDVRSRLKLADLYTRVGDEDRAIESYREVGDRHADKDLYQKAVAVYKQAIRLDPEDPQLHRNVGEAYHRIGRLKDAAQALRRAQKRYKKQGDRDEQLETLEELVRLDPEDVGLKIQLAETYAKQDRADEALDRFREAADMLDEEGRLDDYVQVAERIVHFDPKDLEVRKKAVDIYIERNDQKRALRHLQVCFNHDPDDEDTLQRLAETFMRLDRSEKALLVFEKLAKMHTRRDRDDRAREIWTRILDIDPTHETAQKALRQLETESERERREPSRPERDPAESREVPPIAEEEKPETDALEEVEFLDEGASSGPETPEPEESIGPTVEVDESQARTHRNPPGEQDEFVEVPTEQLGESLPDRPSQETRGERGTPDDAGDPGEAAGSSSERAGLSEELEPVEPGGAAPPETARSGGDSSSEVSEKVEEMFDDADVFLKHEMYDKAREVIQKLLRAAPRNLQAYKRRRRLYVELDEPRAEASTLVDMARLCDDRLARARGYLMEAADLGAPDRALERAASEIGIDYEHIEQRGAEASEPDRASGLQESTAALEEPSSPPDEPRSDASVSGDTDETVPLDPSDVEVLEDAEQPDDEAATRDDAPPERPGVGGAESAETPGDDPDTIETTETPGQTDGGFGAAYETKPPEDPIDRAESGLGTAEGLNFSVDELDSAIDGIFGGGQEAPSEDADDDLLAEVDALIDAGDYDAAEEALRDIERQYPDHPGLRARRQEIREAGGREFQRHSTGSRSLSGEFKALESGEEPISDQVEAEEPETVDAGVEHTSLQLGLSYREMEMYEEAIGEFQEAIKDPDAAPAAKFHIAICKAEKGESEEASNDLARLLRYDDLPGDIRKAARQKLEELEGSRN